MVTRPTGTTFRFGDLCLNAGVGQVCLAHRNRWQSSIQKQILTLRNFFSIEKMESQPTSSMAPEKRDFTYIVIGCGGIGSAALYWLSTQVPGEEVLGIERFELGHHNGGSQDHSRIIRLRYRTVPPPQHVAHPPFPVVVTLAFYG